MQYQDIQQIRDAAESELTNGEIAEAYNNDPKFFRPIPSHRVLAWIGEAGRYAKLKGFIAATADSDDPPTVGLRSAIETLLIAANNPNTEVETAPDSGHRQLLAAAMTAGVLDQSDADDLIRRGRPAGWVDVTAADVQQVIDDHEAERALNALQDRLNDAHSAGTVAVENGSDAAAVKAEFDRVWDEEGGG